MSHRFLRENMKIKLENIIKIYEGSDNSDPALDNVSLDIESGEFFFLLGPSGCGKTTLLRLISGLIEPTAGRIFFNERDVSDIPVDKRRAVMVFQGYALWPHMTVRQNVEFGLKMQNTSVAERRNIVEEQLKLVQMKEYIKRKPNQLSGGQQQRIALARALAAQGECLLLDEPLSNLDASLRLRMRDELKSIVKSSGTTTIYVTHDQKEALSMADRIAVMDRGRIVQVGRSDELYNHPATRFVAEFLGETNFINGCIIDTSPVVKVETSSGILMTESAENIEINSDVTCCIRPERVDLVSEKDKQLPDSVYIPARIISNIFLGEMRQYKCMPEGYDGTPWKVFTLSNTIDKYVGQERVFMKIDPKDVIIIKGAWR